MFSRKEIHPHWPAGGHFLLGIHWNDMPDWTIPCLLRWQHGAPRNRKVCVPEKLREFVLLMKKMVLSGLI